MTLYKFAIPIYIPLIAVLPRHMYPNFFLQSHAPHTCRIPSGIFRVLKGPPNWIVAPELDTDTRTHAHVTLIGSDETIQLSICDWKFTGYHNLFKKYYVLKCALSEKPMYVRYNCYEACAEISRSSRCNSDHNCWNLIYSISSKHSKKSDTQGQQSGAQQVFTAKADYVTVFLKH
jgi:hypothetical protein